MNLRRFVAGGLAVSSSLIFLVTCADTSMDDDSSVSPSVVPAYSPTPGFETPFPSPGGDTVTPEVSPAQTSTPVPTPGLETPTLIPTPGLETPSLVPTPGLETPTPADEDGDGFSIGEGDCNDTDAYTYPGAPELEDGVDNDCDGIVNNGVDTTDNDGDGYSEAEGDCDDTNAGIAPNIEEVPYDGIDQDCSGADRVDVDGDGVPGGLEGQDCDDTDPEIYLGAPEIPYDGVDQDCDGEDLEDVDHDGVPGGPQGEDCDDTDPTRSPDLQEVPYDGIDNDCDGRDLTDVDEDGQDAEGVGDPEAGPLDCDDSDPTIFSGADEIPYDGIDQDCDGVDLVDVDGDGFDGISGGSDSGPLDCDDDDVNTYPGAGEYADGRDNDCDGQIDEDLSTTDDDEDGYSEADGDCNDYNPEVFPGATEKPYDGLDQDCNGADLTDVDGDGYSGGGGRDCNDTDSDIHPGAGEEPYDGIDQDCSGADLTDVDGDGFASTEVDGGTDCNDDSDQVHPGALEVPYDGIDQDCSGEDLIDADEDGYPSDAVEGGTLEGPFDCNDANPDIHPDQDEVCDGLDNNCDGVVDTDAVDRVTFYPDGDHDGFGDPQRPALACASSDALVADNTDCDDSSAQSHPGASEVCDGKDNDCDSTIDEGVLETFCRDADSDGFGNPAVETEACTAPTGFVSDNTDCDDGSALHNPAASEVCDATNVDEDCDGLADDADSSADPGTKTLYYPDADKDGYGDSSKSGTLYCDDPSTPFWYYQIDHSDCKDTNDGVHPGAAETCNNVDDDCNGEIDDGVGDVFYEDSDGDGFGSPSSTVQACFVPDGYVSNRVDCDDSLAGVKPGAVEVCNGRDDNCDGQIDEGVSTRYYQDADGDGFGDPSVTTSACNQPGGFVQDNRDCDDSASSVNPGSLEVCDDNDVDEDCDGVSDDHDPSTSVSGKTRYYPDVDKDGYGDSENTGALYCDDPSSSSDQWTLDHSDCDDQNPQINPAGTETANGVDDNCDGQIDEGIYLGSCKQFKETNPSATTGIYTIDPDGTGPVQPFQVYCDMSTNGGGWTLVFHFYDHTGFYEDNFISRFGHNRFTDATWLYDPSSASISSTLARPIAPLSGEGGVDIGLFTGNWTDVRMTCNQNSNNATVEHFAQLDGYTTKNGNYKLLGATANGTSYSTSSSNNSMGITTVWHDNELNTVNSGHYLCDYTYSGAGTTQFSFCYTDFLHCDNNCDPGDSITAIGFGTTYGSDGWSKGFTGECGSMGYSALLDRGTFSIWIR